MTKEACISFELSNSIVGGNFNVINYFQSNTKHSSYELQSLPTDLNDFVGRKLIIDDLVNFLTAQIHISVPIIVIDGMPGVGKTALAVHIAHHIKDYYPDAQFFIELDGYTPNREPVEPLEALDRLLRRLNISPSRIPKNISECAALWRSQIANLKTVIVLDNAKNLSQVKSLLPGMPGSCVLITSRKKLTGIDNIRSISLDVLEEKEAIELFKNTVKIESNHNTDNVILNIINVFGMLPLAIKLIGSQWQNRSCWIEELASELVGSNEILKELKSDDTSISAVFDESYKKLTSEQRLLFRRIGLHPGSDITPEIVSVVMECDVSHAKSLLVDLFNQSLIIESNFFRFKLHDLLREFAQAKVNEEELETEKANVLERLIFHYLDSIISANRILNLTNQDTIYLFSKTPILKPNFVDQKSAFKWLEQERLNILSYIKKANENHKFTVVFKFSYLLSNFLRNAGYKNDLLSLHNLALKAGNKLNKVDFQAYSLMEIALTYQSSGEFNVAFDYFQKALKCWKECENFHGQARTLEGIGFNLERTGNYNEALINLDSALEIQDIIKNPYREATINHICGAIHWRLKDYEKAMSYFDKALTIRRSIGDDYGMARTINNIGFTFLRLGDYKNAIKNLKASLEIANKLGDKHSKAVTLNNIAYTLGEIKRFKLGIRFASLGLIIAEEIESLYQKGRALDAMAKCLFARGDINEAREKWQAAMIIFDKASVPEVKEVKDAIEKLDGL